MKRVLLFEKSDELAGQLEAALYNSAWTPTRVASLHTARQTLSKERFVAAIVPHENALHYAEALRTAQPDLPILVQANGRRPDLTDAGLVALAKDDRLVDMLEQLTHNGVGPNSPEKLQTVSELLEETWREAAADKSVVMVVLGRGPMAVASVGRADPDLAGQVAAQSANVWQGGPDHLRLHWFSGPRPAEILKLQSRRVGPYLLTVVGLPSASLTALRQVGEVTEQCLEAWRSEIEAGATSPESLRPRTYAVAWQACEPMPEPIRALVQKELERLAIDGAVLPDGALLLKAAAVNEWQVQAVVTSQDERAGAWLAQTLKSATEEALFQCYGIRVSLWQPGYLAVEKDQLLTEFELSLLSDSGDEPD